MIRTETMKDGNKAKVIVDVAGEIVEQEIIKVDDGEVWVKSGNGREYPVLLSDRIVLEGVPVNVGDIAVIRTFNRWVVVDVKPALVDDEVDEFTDLYRKKINGTITEEELKRYNWLKDNDEELQREMKEFEDLLGGY